MDLQQLKLVEQRNEHAQLVHELEDFIYETKQRLSKLDRALRQTGDERLYQRARQYWMAHIRTALDKDHSYLGSSMFTAQDAIDELQDEGRYEG